MVSASFSSPVKSNLDLAGDSLRFGEKKVYSLLLKLLNMLCEVLILILDPPFSGDVILVNIDG